MGLVAAASKHAKSATTGQHAVIDVYKVNVFIKGSPSLAREVGYPSARETGFRWPTVDEL